MGGGASNELKRRELNELKRRELNDVWRVFTCSAVEKYEMTDEEAAAASKALQLCKRNDASISGKF